MKKTILIFIFFLLLVPGFLKAADFYFYGITLGMEKTEVNGFFKITSEYGLHQAENPGHYMSKLFFGFDHKNRLFYIEAYYPLEGNEKGVALSLALKEKFETPIKQLHKDIEIKIDTYKDVSRYGTSQYIVMKLTSNPIRDEYLKYLKGDILDQMK